MSTALTSIRLPRSLRLRSARAFVGSLALLCLAGVAQAASAPAPASAFNGLWQDCEVHQGEEYCESLQLSQQGDSVQAAWNWRASRTGGTDLLKGRVEDGRAVFETPGCEIEGDGQCRPREKTKPTPMVLLRCGRDLHWLHERKSGCKDMKPGSGYRLVNAKALQAEVYDFADFEFFRQP